MDTREKLIELLSQVQYLGGLEEKIADHLIANGVTFATDNNVGHKWISVKERLPEDELPKETERKQIRCVVFTDKGSVKTCVRQRYRTKRHGVWGYTAWEWSKSDFAKPTHWMPLPEPPKED